MYGYKCNFFVDEVDVARFPISVTDCPPQCGSFVAVPMWKVNTGRRRQPYTEDFLNLDEVESNLLAVLLAKPLPKRAKLADMGRNS